MDISKDEVLLAITNATKKKKRLRKNKRLIFIGVFTRAIMKELEHVNPDIGHSMRSSVMKRIHELMGEGVVTCFHTGSSLYWILKEDYECLISTRA